MAERVPTSEPERMAPYTVIAAGYDFLMAHVEYETWAAYVHILVQQHHLGARSVLELGCGTGSLAFLLQPLGSYRYVATDRSEHMLDVARRKAESDGVDVRFERADFSDFEVDTPVDVIVLLYDGLNYALDLEGIRRTFRCAFRALSPSGVFIVDQSTPHNSIKNEAFFEHSDSLGDFSYVRRSRYDRETRIHRTTLDVTVGDRTYREEHLQRAYDLSEVRHLAEEAGFRVEAVYDGFSTVHATNDSERVHWVLRRPG